MMKALAAAILVCCAAAPAFANVRPDGDTDFSWKPKVGQVRKYKLQVAMSADFGGQSMDINVSMLNVSEVKKIESDKVTLEAHVEDFKLVMNGNETEPPTNGDQQPAAIKATVVQSLKTGETLSTTAEGTGGQQQSPRVQNLSLFRRPDAKVKVGDSWNSEIKEDKEKKTPAATAKFTLAGEETLLNHKCWKVTYAYTETGVAQPFGATGTYWIDQEEGSPVKFEANYENVVFNEMMPPTNAKVTMVLVP